VPTIGDPDFRKMLSVFEKDIETGMPGNCESQSLLFVDRLTAVFSPLLSEDSNSSKDLSGAVSTAARKQVVSRLVPIPHA
jgi:hypothetical protein